MEAFTEMLITTYYAAIGDEITYRIGLLISRYALSVNEIAATLDLPQPRVSHKLAKLRKHGCVNFEREGKRVFYRLDEPCRSIIIRGDNNWRKLNPEFRNKWAGDIKRVKEVLGPEIGARTIRPLIDDDCK